MSRVRTTLADEHCVAVSITKGARILDVDRQTLRRFINEGRVRAFKLGDGRNSTVRVPLADLYALVGLAPDGTPLPKEAAA